MNILDFKGKAQAEAWKKDVEDLNDRTDQILGKVYSCIEEIKTEYVDGLSFHYVSRIEQVLELALKE